MSISLNGNHDTTNVIQNCYAASVVHNETLQPETLFSSGLFVVGLGFRLKDIQTIGKK